MREDFIETRIEVIKNIYRLYKYAVSNDIEEKKFGIERLSKGKWYVVERIGDKILFGPSRFVGYKENNIEKYINEGKGDGTETNSNYEDLQLYEENKSDFIINEYKKYISSLNISRDFIPKFLIPKNYNDSSFNEKINTFFICPTHCIGQKSKAWDSFRKNNIIAIGWEDFDYTNKTGEEIHQEYLDNYSDRKEANNAGKAFKLFKKIKPGDIVCCTNNNKGLFGIGIATSSYKFKEKIHYAGKNSDNNDSYYSHYIEIAWIVDKYISSAEINFNKESMWEPYGTISMKDGITNYITNYLFNNSRLNTYQIMENQNEIVKILNSKKQIIFQGAPGTGKTYYTPQIAIELCDNKSYEGIPHNQIMDRYNVLVKEERIAFTTFHQSMDYEEFVEGLKPVKDSNSMCFEPKAGIFKQMCEKSILSTIVINNKITKELEFYYIYDNLVEKIKDYEIQNLTTKTGSIINLSVSSEKNIVFTHNNSVKKYTVSKKRLGELYKEIDTIEKLEAINNINDDIRKVIGGCNSSGYWTVLKYILENRTIEEDNETQIEDLEYKNQSNLIQNLLNTPKQERELIKDKKPYVLIIDEINRGNISKILGELITLLEADKRIGEENELQATLPYSNEKFAVPSNLYIIGTMNTADRSLGYIDYAIRRRFAFWTLESNNKVIEGYYSYERLRIAAIRLFNDVKDFINSKIASDFNIDDLMIGHSYFLAKDEEDLKLKLEYEIKPLLREYANDGILDKIKKEKGKYEEIEQLTIRLIQEDNQTQEESIDE